MPAGLYSANHAYGLLMQKDGNLVVYSPAKTPLRATGTKAGASSFLTTQNDGNVVIYSSPGGSAIWASGS